MVRCPLCENEAHNKRPFSGKWDEYDCVTQTCPITQFIVNVTKK